MQGTARDLATDLGLPPDELDYRCAGINHLAFYLELSHRGRDVYPELRAKRDIPEWNRVRYEVLRHFGYFCTESSEHLAEYVPWFIKGSRPELVDEFNIPLDEYPRRCEAQLAEWEALRTRVADLSVERSDEYGARIIHALETGEPFEFNGNVMNDGLIDNLPYCCVEVPCIADGNGITPQPVGRLPPQLAGADPDERQRPGADGRGGADRATETTSTTRRCSTRTRPPSCRWGRSTTSSTRCSRRTGSAAPAAGRRGAARDPRRPGA